MLAAKEGASASAGGTRSVDYPPSPALGLGGTAHLSTKSNRLR